MVPGTGHTLTLLMTGTTTRVHAMARQGASMFSQVVSTRVELTPEPAQVFLSPPFSWVFLVIESRREWREERSERTKEEESEVQRQNLGEKKK